MQAQIGSLTQTLDAQRATIDQDNMRSRQSQEVQQTHIEKLKEMLKRKNQANTGLEEEISYLKEQLQEQRELQRVQTREANQLREEYRLLQQEISRDKETLINDHQEQVFQIQNNY